METHKRKIPSVLPYKLVRYSPKVESQILMTTRREKTVKLPYVPRKELKPHSIADDKLSIISTFRETFSSIPSTATETSSENMQRLTRLSKSSANMLSKNPQPESKLVRKSLRKDNKIRTIITVEDKELVDPDESRDSIFQHRKQLVLFEDVFWISRKRTGNIACARESGQSVIIGDTLYLYGGQSRLKHREMNVLNLRSFDWKILESKSCPPGRLGHSCVAYKRTLVTYGGWVTDKLNSHIPRCSKSMYLFDTLTFHWKKLYQKGMIPLGRRHHCAVMLGRDMLIYGGIATNGERLDDFLAFDLSDMSWRCPAVEFNEDPGKRSHFSLTPVFHTNFLKDHSSSLEDMHSTKWVNALKNSGIYLFGGLDNDGQPSNDVFVLCYIRRKLRWVEISPSGKQPTPRYGHQAACIKSCFFVFGGRNDQYGVNGFNDLFVFNVENLKWENVTVHGNVPQARWGHCMNTNGNRILLLGGINSITFMSSDVHELETDVEYVDELIYNMHKNN